MIGAIVMSSISLACAGAASLSAPVLAASAAAAALEAETAAPASTDAATEAAVETNEDLLVPPGAAELAPAPPSTAADVIVPDGEQYTGPLAFEGESDAVVVDRVIAALEAVDTLKGDFTQIAPSGSVSTGTFYLRRPGMLRFEYDPPTPLLIVANGGLVYVEDEALETTDSYPVGRTPLKYLLSKTIDLDGVDVKAVDRGVDSVAITLASLDDETEGEISIILDADSLDLRRWIVRDVQNGITIVTLDNVVKGERLANRLFRAPEAGGAFLKN